MKKIQNSKQNRFDHLGLKIGIYLGFGICYPNSSNGSFGINSTIEVDVRDAG
jgi:hypothetical protein